MNLDDIALNFEWLEIEGRDLTIKTFAEGKSLIVYGEDHEGNKYYIDEFYLEDDGLH